jgi:hypothetical protein
VTEKLGNEKSMLHEAKDVSGIMTNFAAWNKVFLQEQGFWP